MSNYIEVRRILEYLDVMISALSFPLSVAGEDAKAYVEGFKEARSVVERFPTADVEPVVRCKDCRHHSAAAGVCNLYLHFSVGVSANDYCSFGEKRTV